MFLVLTMLFSSSTTSIFINLLFTKRMNLIFLLNVFVAQQRNSLSKQNKNKIKSVFLKKTTQEIIISKFII